MSMSKETPLTCIRMTEDDFHDTYGQTLLPNHFNSNACWTYGDGPGCLFETYGEELAFVRQQNPSTIWTLVDGPEDHTELLLSGAHWVNRLGYLISTKPVPPGVAIEVRLEGELPEEPEYVRLD